MKEPVDALDTFSRTPPIVEEFSGLCQWPTSNGQCFGALNPLPRDVQASQPGLWAGWQGALWPEYSSDRHKPRQFQPYLQIWKAEQDRLLQIFNTPNGTKKGTIEVGAYFEDDPLTEVARLDSKDLDFNIRQLSPSRESWLPFCGGHLVFNSDQTTASL
jgi:hypothetical protein